MIVKENLTPVEKQDVLSENISERLDNSSGNNGNNT